MITPSEPSISPRENNTAYIVHPAVLSGDGDNRDPEDWTDSNDDHDALSRPTDSDRHPLCLSEDSPTVNDSQGQNSGRSTQTLILSATSNNKKRLYNKRILGPKCGIVQETLKAIKSQVIKELRWVYIRWFYVDDYEDLVLRAQPSVKDYNTVLI